MAFAQDIRNKLFAGALSIGLAFGAAAPSFAQDTSANENVQKTSLQAFETVDHDTAKARSTGGVVLHFGNGFPEIAVKGMTDILSDRGYKVTPLAGGSEDQLTLCIDGKCLDKNFNRDNLTLLTTVVDHFGSYLLAKSDEHSPSQT